ncbi:MAG: hypothetical protein ACOYLX_21025 [Burkholderiaceae bacterium]
MPSLFKFLFVVGTIFGVCYGGLYVLATQFEPEPHQVTQPLPGVKVKK